MSHLLYDVGILILSLGIAIAMGSVAPGLIVLGIGVIIHSIIIMFFNRYER